jgi:hypothetical protein
MMTLRHRHVELWPEIMRMSISRTFIAMATTTLAFATIANAADTPVFTVAQNDSNGQAKVFESTAVLKKGDAINIRAINAQLVAVLYVAMCNQDCPNMHVIKAVPLSYWGQTMGSQQIVLPEDGRVAIWMRDTGGSSKTPIGVVGGTVWTVQYVGPSASYATGDPTQGSVPASSYTSSDGTLRARFYHRTFITVSLASSNI